MRRTKSDLLDEYRHADFSKRLHLYMQYPELRSEFIETDRNELKSGVPEKIPGSKRFRKFFTCTFGKTCSFPGKA